MSAVREVEYKGSTITISVSKAGKDGYIGNFTITPPEPPLKGDGADSSSEDGAFENAERRAKELIDKQI